MSGRESWIGAGLALVLVVGIIDAAAGHKGGSSSDASSPTHGTVATPTPPTPTSTATAPKPHRRHHAAGGGAASSAASAPTPTTAPTSAGGSNGGGSSASGDGSGTTSAPPSSSKVPDGVLGTFTYDTKGSEGTNIPGTQRSFPKQTTITNKLAGCGISSTWKPIPEHVQKQVLCPASDGIKVTAYQTKISFYGVTSGESFKCSGPSYVYRNGVKAGDTWTFKCKSPDAVAVQKSEAIGFETVDVGGTPVRALHVHVDTKLKGNDSGTSTQDYWIATKKPVLVKETGKVTATQQSVHYSSTYSLALTSLSPKT